MPVAFIKCEFVMPSSAAFAFIMLAKAVSDPPNPSANVTAASFYIGLVYSSWIELSEQFPSKGQNGVGDGGNTAEGTLRVGRIQMVCNQTAGLVCGVWTKRTEEDFGAYGPIDFGLGAFASPVGPLDAAPNVLALFPNTPATNLDDLTPSLMVRRTSGKQTKHTSKTGKLNYPINKKSTHAIIRFASTEHLPFRITGAIWTGNYVDNAQRI